MEIEGCCSDPALLSPKSHTSSSAHVTVCICLLLFCITVTSQVTQIQFWLAFTTCISTLEWNASATKETVSLCKCYFCVKKIIILRMHKRDLLRLRIIRDILFEWFAELHIVQMKSGLAGEHHAGVARSLLCLLNGASVVNTFMYIQTSQIQYKSSI